jgi:hypothetical protein
MVVWNHYGLSERVEIITVDVQSQWLVNVSFHKIIEVIFSTQDTSRPTNNPITVWHEARTFGRAALKDIHHMPYIVPGELWFAHAHAQTQ